MLKLICRLSILFCLSEAVAEESRLCPKPAITEPDLTSTDPRILHEYMQKANNSAKQLDWVKDKNAQGACQGYYREPLNPNTQKSVEQKNAETFISADSVTTEDKDTLLLKGNVETYKGAMRLSCDQMRYNQISQAANIEGHLNIRETGFLLQADKGRISNHFATVNLDNATFLMHKNPVRGTAQTLSVNTQNDQEQLTLKQAMVSSCPPNQNNWTLNASTIELDNKAGWGEAYNAVIRIEKLPVFYFPYINFPINDNRKTGFLFPSLSLSSNNVDITAPYYLNIAPNVDMTYTPRLQTAHALGHGVEARYKNRWSEWQLNGQFIANDKKIGANNVQPLNKSDRNRWAYGLKEQGQINPFLHAFINFQAVSDNDYFQDWGSQGLDINKTLNIRREAFLGFNAHNWQVNTRLIDYQTLETTPDPRTLYRQLPRIDIAYQNVVEPFVVTPTFHNQYVNFQHKKNRVEASRFFTEPGFSYHAFWPYASIKSDVTYKRLDMLLEQNNDPSDYRTPAGYLTEGHQSLDIPTLSIDSQLVFEREHNGYLQTFTPRLFYYYAHFENQDHLPSFDTSENTFSYQQLFRGERFNGYDRIADADQLTAALSTQFFNQHDGRLLADLGMGQIYYAYDRKVALNATDRQRHTITPSMTKDEKAFYKAWNNQVNRRFYNATSDLATQLNVYPTRRQKVTFNTLVNTTIGEFQEASIHYQYRHNNWQLFNLGYRYIRNVPLQITDTQYLTDDINEVDVSVIWPITQGWSGIARYQYDINRNEQADRILGVAYDSCCLNVMFAYQRERRTYDIYEWKNNGYSADYKDYFMLEFTLKGLGTINSTITKMLTEKFLGFRRDG